MHLPRNISLPLRFTGGFLLVALFMAGTAQAATEKRSLDRGWKFHEGDIPFPVISGHGNSYNNAKAGKAWGAAAPEFDDSQWRVLDLPHDWAVEQPFEKSANLSQGYRRRGFAWYRRGFLLDSADRGKSLELQFDGISTHCQVWLNGTLVHRNWCGYTGFNIDLTPFANYGDRTNTLAIRVDANAMEGWWYEGAGIYRHTWLIKRNPVHIETDGVFAHPVKRPDGSWELPVEVTLANIGKEAATGGVQISLLDPEGREVASTAAPAVMESLVSTVVKLNLPVKNPRLWSVDAPTLYTVRTRLLREGQPQDSMETRCGFRTIRFDAEKGFFLNEVPMKIKGTCNHQDHAGVGVAVPDSLWDFRVRRLKELGSNAYRCAHNPPAKEFLDACDRLGMLVMDENRNFNVSPEYTRQLEWMVRRDRNHPSVMMWSVFNEETTQGTEMGYEMVRRMVAAVKRMDSSRPVTAAMSGGHKSPINVSQAVDVVGFNYNQNVFDDFHKQHPDLPITSSEDTSAFMTRGVYETDHKKNLIGSYDDQRAPWGLTHRDAWRHISERPFVAGGFVWTGFDYRGEPTPLQWPSAGSFFGIMDQCGFPKAAYYLHQAHWIEDKPVLQLIPHWNWPGKEGSPVKVMALTNADSVKLILNGKELGEKPVDKIDMVGWEVPYAPGKLEAIAMKAGKEWSRTSVETTGPPVALKIIPDRDFLSGDSTDALPASILAVDGQGRPVPTANLMVQFKISGPGAIIGVGNGDPNSHEPEKAHQRSLFNGLAQVILQSAQTAGDLTLVATADGLTPAECNIKVNAVPLPAMVPVPRERLALANWQQSPATRTRPDPNQIVPENDRNSWSAVSPGKVQAFSGGTFRIFRIEFQPYAKQKLDGCEIKFSGIAGKAEIWLDGLKTGEKADFKTAPLTVPLAAGNDVRKLSVLIETEENKPGGLTGQVLVE